MPFKRTFNGHPIKPTIYAHDKTDITYLQFPE